MDTPEAHESIERFEKAEEAAEGREHFARRAALLVAVLAACLAVATLFGNRAAEGAILSQAKASDTYNEYQANSLKRHINEDNAAVLRLLSAGTPNEAAAKKQADALDKAVKDKYRPNQDRLLPEARKLEAERDAAERQHRTLQLSEGAFQIGIVLASVAIISRVVALLWVSGLLGLLGAAAFAESFLQIFNHLLNRGG